MNLFKIIKTETKVVPIYRFSTRLRLKEWRSEQAMVSAAKKFLTNPEFAPMVDVLKNESPANWMLPPASTTEQRAIQQGRIEGYQICINNLEAMGVFQKLEEPLETTYEQPE